MDHCTKYLSPLGPLLLTSDGEALTGLWIEGQPAPRERMPEDPELPLFRQTKSWLDAYFSGLAPDPAELPLAPAGSPFRQQVWSLLLEIPWGETRSYGEIAREIARRTGKSRMSAQAVGGAVGSNPISIIIPCHRIIGANGALTGYAGGLDKKIWLLGHEGHRIRGDRLI